MRMPLRELLVAALPLAAHSVLPAQNTDSRGLLAGSATAVLVDGGLPSGTADGTMLVHPTSIDQPPARLFPAASSAPDLDLILSSFFVGPSPLDIDDISTGRDDIMVDQDGFLSIPQDQWSVWSFSLRADATGAPGSRIEAEANGGSVGAALFSYVLPGSHLPAEVVGVVERSHSRRDLGLAGSSSTNVDAIDVPLILGVDQQLTLISGATALEPNWQPLIGTSQVIFFTVSHDSRDLVPSTWWGSHSRSGANILVTSRATPTGTWTTPSVWLSYEALGLDQDEDIDALAIEANSEKLLFSTTGTARDQFLFLDLTTDTGPVPRAVRKQDGTKVSESIGKADGDDVDAVCTLDPSLEDVDAIAAGGDDFGSSCGAPRPGLLGIPEIDGSAFRRYEGGQIHFDSFMVGWPDSTGPAQSLAAAFLTFDDSLDLLLIGGLHLRDPLNLIPGDPQSETIVVPPALALNGARVTFRWLHIDGTAFSLHEVRPVQVFL